MFLCTLFLFVYDFYIYRFFLFSLFIHICLLYTHMFIFMYEYIRVCVVALTKAICLHIIENILICFKSILMYRNPCDMIEGDNGDE